MNLFRLEILKENKFWGNSKSLKLNFGHMGQVKENIGMTMDSKEIKELKV